METESKLTKLFSLIFNVKYNLGVIILSFLTWFLCFFFSYSSSNNFNLYPTIVNYIIWASVGGILFGKTLVGKPQDGITKNAIVSMILGIFALIFVRAFAAQDIGLYIIAPLSFYSFFDLLKAIWKAC